MSRVIMRVIEKDMMGLLFSEFSVVCLFVQTTV
jgi:hypothetical protein